MDDSTVATTAVLTRIEYLLQVIAKVQLAPLVERELVDDRTRSLYELTGTVTAAEAARKLKLGKKTVLDTWKRWESLGLVMRDGKQYKKAI